MNTLAEQVTIYSGMPDGKPSRPGSGPSFYEWLSSQAEDDRRQGSYTYEPRHRYGLYLLDAYRSFLKHLPPGVSLKEVIGRVGSLRPCSRGYQPELENGSALPEMDKIILTTGHPRNVPDLQERTFLDFGRRHNTRYVRGDSAADLPLSYAKAGNVVGVCGMGLGFYDIIAAFTLGRGGAYERGPKGNLIYRPSGDEPDIVAGSRRGIPTLARGRNQKKVGRSWKPRFLTREAVMKMRERKDKTCGSTQLDFMTDIWPLLLDDVQCVYFAAHVRLASGEGAAEEFSTLYRKLREKHENIDALVDKFDLQEVSPLDIERAADPFKYKQFDSPQDYQQAVLDILRYDVTEARKGNIDSPFKSALDTIRDLRPLIREIVAFGGLSPRSYREDFRDKFCPLHSLLAAGPPLEKTEYIAALLESGHLRLVGPRINFGTDEELGRFTASSSQVRGSRMHLDMLIDSRIPDINVQHDASMLTRQLLRDQIIREYINGEAGGLDISPTGGVAVDRDTFRVLRGDGGTDPHLYAVGIPTEGPVWFTAVGSGRTTGQPGVLPDYADEADIVAKDVLR